MALIEETLFGTVDKVQIAIDRLKAFEPADGYWLAFSGGKDSVVIKRLAQMAFWRGWYEIGARHACHMADIDRVYMFDGVSAFPKGQLLSTLVDTGLKKGETLDLAELLGKDAT